MNKNDHKIAIKEGLQEWLDDKFIEFGKLSLKGLLAILLAGLVYLWSASNGWKLQFKPMKNHIIFVVSLLIALPISPLIACILYGITS